MNKFITENDSIERSAKLLLNGAKMLQIPCPQCKTPIYQLKGNILFCTLCNQNLVREEDIQKNENVIHTTSPIKNKIKELSIQLEKETIPSKIVELSKLIKELENIESGI